ncbi:hypothetical protein BO82DRAFT_123451 [Aspergillus uvarum CBS 121591]|uniref:Uncharacterized protein n=1 Tax=Aspergillus uvarum CBS 121591 TaxID=1448315 RepID=A0A319C3T2_9EURO|nr:hypothetical protein BO82DRAFT_123451 [Aspergillus uvarum CBS 121591]PYH79805.1 hypothetical protein BO82DRAFT_123451 [Aspergillus uvarum CBS 121591]
MKPSKEQKPALLSNLNLPPKAMGLFDLLFSSLAGGGLLGVLIYMVMGRELDFLVRIKMDRGWFYGAYAD